jgi:hypothetical protein
LIQGAFFAFGISFNTCALISLPALNLTIERAGINTSIYRVTAGLMIESAQKLNSQTSNGPLSSSVSVQDHQAGNLLP